jgi:hypothetical protein
MCWRNVIAIAGAALVLALTVAVSGCGDDAAEATGTIAKARFLKAADVICRQGTKEIGRLDLAAWRRYDPHHRAAGQAVLNKVALALLPAREKELRRIRALGLPRGHEKFVEAMLDAWAEGIAEGRARPRRLRASGLDFAFYEAYEMGIDFGLEKCWLG